MPAADVRQLLSLLCPSLPLSLVLRAATCAASDAAPDSVSWVDAGGDRVGVPTLRDSDVCLPASAVIRVLVCCVLFEGGPLARTSIAASARTLPCLTPPIPSQGFSTPPPATSRTPPTGRCPPPPPPTRPPTCSPPRSTRPWRLRTGANRRARRSAGAWCSTPHPSAHAVLTPFRLRGSLHSPWTIRQPPLWVVKEVTEGAGVRTSWCKVCELACCGVLTAASFTPLPPLRADGVGPVQTQGCGEASAVKLTRAARPSTRAVQRSRTGAHAQFTGSLSRATSMSHALSAVPRPWCSTHQRGRMGGHAVSTSPSPPRSSSSAARLRWATAASPCRRQ